jgi:N-alpha-acetyltransferase 15/16, NatA auxiliary subunit
LALKCLLTVHSLDPSDPTLHTQVYRFRSMTEKTREDIPPRISEIILLESKNFFDGDQSDSDWNESFISTHKSSPSHVQAGLRVQGLIDKDSREQNEKDLIETLSLQGMTLAEATAGLGLLEEWRSSAEVVAAYKQAARSIWNEATAFKMSQHQGDLDH